MIRIDDVRALRHDLHMRPFEADRRVYLVLDAERMNEDAADALLKDLEEPPPYAVIVLVASELGPLPPTILSAASSSRSEALRARRPRVDRGEAPERARTKSAPSPAPPRGGSIARAASRLGRGRPARGADRRRTLRLPRAGLRARRPLQPACSRSPTRTGRRRGGPGASGARGRRSPSARSGPARASCPARRGARRDPGWPRGARGVGTATSWSSLLGLRARL